jgi:hypothetical protein
MTSKVRALLKARQSGDAKVSYDALQQLFAMSEQPVRWAYEVWDDLVNQLKNGDNHERAFAAQMLSRLAISDPETRIFKVMPALEDVMRDERFVTARHTIQSLWRAGIPTSKHTAAVVRALTRLYGDCPAHKNAALIRCDLVETLAKLGDAVGRERIEKSVDQLLSSETDAKACKKQLAIWRRKASARTKCRHLAV